MEVNFLLLEFTFKGMFCGDGEKGGYHGRGGVDWQYRDFLCNMLYI